MVKKIMFVAALISAIGFSSCESKEDVDSDSKCTYVNPFSDDLEIGGYSCVGDASTGNVEICVWVTSIGNVSRFYFGELKAFGNGETYRTSYVGNVDTPKDVEVRVGYEGDYTTLKNVDTSLKKFDKVIINVNPSNSGSVQELTFSNMPITWE